MSCSKPKVRKVDNETRIFRDIWTEMYFFTEFKGKATCVICQENVSVLKEYNIRRHYVTKHSNMYDTFSGRSRVEKAEELKNQLTKQQLVFKKLANESSSAVEASYAVSYKIGKELKPFTMGQFVKDCMLTASEIVCPDKKQCFSNISLSRNTVAQRVRELADNMTDQLREKVQTFQFFSVCADESTDNTDLAQIMFFLRGVDDNLQVTEELAQVAALHGTTTGQDVFGAFLDMLNYLGLPLEKLAGLATDGAPSMVGKILGFVSRVQAKQLEVNSPIKAIPFHCIIHQQALCSKVANLENVMKVVVKTVNYIKARGLNHRQFQQFLIELETEYTDVIYHCEVRWLSRGNVLKRFLELREEIDMFMIHKENAVPELSDPEWLADFSFLVDLTAHLNTLNCKLQGRDLIITEAFDLICAFERKLQLWASQLERGCYDHFEHLNKMKVTLEASNVIFDSTKYASKVLSVYNAFKKRFSDFREEEVKLQLFSNPFVINPELAPGPLQMELIDLQCNTLLKTKFQTTTLKVFYQELPEETFPLLRKHAACILSLFASSYLCEQAFSSMNLVKTKLRSRLTETNLHANLRIALAVDLKPDIANLVKKKQCQVSSAAASKSSYD